MHNVIESEYSVYTDGVPGALMAEIMVRKIDLTENFKRICNLYTWKY